MGTLICNEKDLEENPLAMPSITHLLKALLDDYLNLSPNVQDAINQHASAVAKANLTRKKDASTQTMLFKIDAGIQTDISSFNNGAADIEPVSSMKQSKPKPDLSADPEKNESPETKGHLERFENPLLRKNICWNCGSPEHLHKVCPLPRMGFYCYGCGARNTMVKDCDNCRNRLRSKKNTLFKI